MTQASIVISNGPGAVVRAALNSANEAMTTKHAGSSAPSATFQFMDWADTANDTLWMRNAANSAWIEKGTLSAAYGGLPASSIVYNPGSPALLAATDVQAAIDELAANTRRSKSGSFTRDISLATGSQAVTGVGFQPSSVSFYAVVDSTSMLSNGFDDGVTANCVSDKNNIAGNQYADIPGSSIYLISSGANQYQGKISSMDSDGFTISWQKVGTPTGTAKIMYMALR